MKVTAIRTKKIIPVKKSILEVLDEHLPDLPDRSILAVTSKIVSICEGRFVELFSVANKLDLVRKEADQYLDEKEKEFLLTIKNNIIIPNAGIDESNGDGCYILWPKNPQRSANQLFKYLCKRFPGRKLGVIITDSTTRPLQRGTTGISLAHSGFQALRNYVGKPDLFGRELEHTQANLADGLAAAAVFAMGEGGEQTPLAVIEDLNDIIFQASFPSKAELKSHLIDISDDIYSRLLLGPLWHSGKDF